jgi:amidophosphoribosyltransferase
VECDVVIAVPDSGVVCALGYAAEAGVPFQQGLIRSHYVGRTFIEPSQKIRDFGVKLKVRRADCGFDSGLACGFDCGA